jgi:osmoprotectant transport system permease protein
MKVAWLILALAAGDAFCTESSQLAVGSKRFTESYILGEIIAQSARAAAQAEVIHKPGLGNTGIVFAALKSGAIDIYPEYTGTLALEILGGRVTPELAAINRGLAPIGLKAGARLGFNNTYAFAMLEEKAARLGIRLISDVAKHPDLKFGLSPEFLNRHDGWPAAKAAYDLRFMPRGIEHGLAYEALAAGEIEVMDIYSTDAKIAKYRLRVLEDDRKFFPNYDAVLVYRADFPERFPRAWEALKQLEGKITAERMIAMNAEAELSGIGFAEVARRFLAEQLSGEPSPKMETAGSGAAGGLLNLLLGPDFARLTVQHLVLVIVSVVCGVLVGVPLGIFAARTPSMAQGILSGVGVIQTIPSLALLAFLIPLLNQIGTLPALIALFLYSLLPIVRNTHSGLADIPAPLLESARALGLPAGARLRLIELPLAARSILSGIKISAVINVGTATIAAFIGAGGYGERIAAGLALNDNALLLAGALPAAAMALLVQGLFELLDRWLIPAGLEPSR